MLSSPCCMGDASHCCAFVKQIACVCYVCPPCGAAVHAAPLPRLRVCNPNVSSHCRAVQHANRTARRVSPVKTTLVIVVCLMRLAPGRGVCQSQVSRASGRHSCQYRGGEGGGCMRRLDRDSTTPVSRRQAQRGGCGR